MGVRVLRKGKKVERTMVFHHIFVSVPRTFGDYCTSVWEKNSDEVANKYQQSLLYFQKKAGLVSEKL